MAAAMAQQWGSSNGLDCPAHIRRRRDFHRCPGQRHPGAATGQLARTGNGLGQLFYATGANSLEAIDLGAEGTILLSGSQIPAWNTPLGGSLTTREVLDDSSDDGRVALWGVYRQSFHEAL